jgi:hypothetical protein
VIKIADPSLSDGSVLAFNMGPTWIHSTNQAVLVLVVVMGAWRCSDAIVSLVPLEGATLEADILFQEMVVKIAFCIIFVCLVCCLRNIEKFSREKPIRSLSKPTLYNSLS